MSKHPVVLFASALGLIALTACSAMAEQPPFDPNSVPVETDVVGGSGQTIGTLVLLEGPHGVLGRIELKSGSLTPGWHGLHIHQIGVCADHGVFSQSGDLLGKIDGGHGLINPAGPQAGDLPNLYAGSNGAAAMEFFTDRFVLSDLRDEDGAALIVRAGRDDHISQPAGGAGGRVACAVLN